MTDVVLVAIIAAIPSTIAAVLSWKNIAKTEQVHKATNSMKDELVAATKSASFQAGRTAGVRDRKAIKSSRRK
jgi:hypothetical protein